MEDAVGVQPHVVGRAHLRHLGDVGAGDEIAAVAGEHDRRDVGVVRERLQAFDDLLLDLQVQRIAALGPLDGDDADRTLPARRDDQPRGPPSECAACTARRSHGETR